MLTEVGDREYETRFDIALLIRRLLRATTWVKQQEILKELSVGYFGASTGTAAALKAAAKDKNNTVHAVVTRGGRPDLAGVDLQEVTAPTLLIVGAYDDPVIKLNHQAYESLYCAKSLKIIPGASHLFEEPGTLEQAACLASEWFVKYLAL